MFLDEPTTGIDVKSARQIRKLISAMNDKSTTIFMTTHYIEEAERLCNRIGFIVQGKIVRTGTVEEMMQEVQTDSIIQFNVDKDLKNVIVSVILISVTSTFLRLFIAVSVREVFEAQTFSNFFRFPMIFLCGLFIPLSQMPVVTRPLSFILPLTYGVDILKAAINNEGYIPMWISFTALILFGLFMFLFSIRNVKRKWIM